MHVNESSPAAYNREGTIRNSKDINITNASLSNVTFSAKGASTLKLVSDVVITTTLIVIMLGMGCTIEFWKLMEHLRRPIGAAIGMLAQFIILPLVTFGFAHALQLEPVAAIGMLVMGCCPGGSTSNMFSYWADGDVPLSLTMTTLATLMALGMMPLNVWLYSRSWTNEDLVIPYMNIIISLIMTVGPAAFGIFLRWKWEKFALIIVKIGSICGGIAVILTMTLMSLLYPFMYKSSWKIYVGAFFLPFVGFAFGYIVAKICRMNSTHARTVALETGIQNFPLCMTLISSSFPKHVIPKLVLFPLLYGIFVLTNSCIFVLFYHIVRKTKDYRNKSAGKDFTSVPTTNNHDGVEMNTVEPVLNGNL
ncbi:ileal sodium/bile acid cotransporter-like [Mercenaria mercenaria]|uniref:ileal sodium/bile acid cotransporter-like n=1 Tax=Mercenaria mercenaria TaxID=6596 RepID=UPI00234F5895|nr:ileal sodium/bile acid cotransporter-like [Mercenaria mercenaria]